MPTTHNIKIGDSVTLHGKGAGVVAFIGTTSFASGEWVGVTLINRTGRNDGSVDGQTYFTCTPGHGVFVRPSQVINSGSREESSRPIRTNRSSASLLSESGRSMRGVSAKSANLRNATRTSTMSSNTSLDVDTSRRSQMFALMTDAGRNQCGTEMDDIDDEKEGEEEDGRHLIEEEEEEPEKLFDVTLDDVSADASKFLDSNLLETHHLDVVDVTQLRERISVAEKKCEELTTLRCGDKQALKEFDRMKFQVQQLLEYKSQSQQQLADLTRQLSGMEKKYTEASNAYDAYKEEMFTVESQIENVTLDKEMCEEKVETLEMERDELKRKLEEIVLQYDILRIQLDRPDAVDAITTHRCEQQQMQIERLNSALLAIRDSSALDKKEINDLKKTITDLNNKMVALEKSNSQLTDTVEKTEIANFDLKEQVDAALGAEQMISFLTEKNLTLEEKTAEMEEKLKDMHAMYEIDAEISENLREENKELRTDLDRLNLVILEEERKIEALKYTIADRDQNILKFRDLVKTLQDECENFRNQIAIYEAKDESLRKLNITETRAKQLNCKLFEEQIKSDTLVLESKLMGDFNDALQRILPNPVKASGEFLDLCNTLFIAERVMNKCKLIERSLKRCVKGEDHADIELSFTNMIMSRVRFLSSLTRRIHSVILWYDDETIVNALVLSNVQINSANRSLDSLLELIKRKQLSEKDSLKSIEKLIYIFENVAGTYVVEEAMQNVLSDLSLSIMYSMVQISTDLKCVEELFVDTIISTEEYDAVKQSLSVCHANTEKLHNIFSSSSVDIGVECWRRMHHAAQNVMKISLVIRKICQSVWTRACLTVGQMDTKELEGIICQTLEDITLTETNAPLFTQLRDILGDVQPLVSELLTNTKKDLENLDVSKGSKTANLSSLEKTVEKWNFAWKKSIALEEDFQRNEESMKELKSSLATTQNTLSEEKVKNEHLERKLRTTQDGLLNAEERVKTDLKQKEFEIQELKRESESMKYQRRSETAELKNIENRLRNPHDQFSKAQLQSVADANKILQKENDRLRAERVEMALASIPKLTLAPTAQQKTRRELNQKLNTLQFKAFSTVANFKLTSGRACRTEIPKFLNELSLLNRCVSELKDDFKRQHNVYQI